MDVIDYGLVEQAIKCVGGGGGRRSGRRELSSWKIFQSSGLLEEVLKLMRKTDGRVCGVNKLCDDG